MTYLYKKQKVFSLTEQFRYLDINERLIYQARGSFFSLPKKYQLLDINNTPLITVSRRMFTFMPKYDITSIKNNQHIGSINKRFTFGRPRFDLIDSQGNNYIVQGSLFAHNFQIFNPHNQLVIEVRKKIITWGDTYEIMVDESQINIIIAMGIVLAIDCAIFSNN